jgi:hypothetical protein
LVKDSLNGGENAGIERVTINLPENRRVRFLINAEAACFYSAVQTRPASGRFRQGYLSSAS